MKDSHRRRMENSVVANREAKPRGLISLHEDAEQLPWNDTLAEKHRGAGGGSTKTLTFPASLFGMRLILVNGAGLSGHPIGLLQLDAPEMRSRGDEFDAHALALLGIIAKIDHSAFLLFLRGGIGEYEQRSYFQVLLGVEQSAMGIDNDRFAGMLESPALLILARELYPDSHEHSGAASFAFVDGCIHGTTMVGYGYVCGQFLRWIRVPWGATALLDNVWTAFGQDQDMDEGNSPAGPLRALQTRPRGSRPPCTARAGAPRIEAPLQEGRWS
jgi:hypothetical protein